MDLSGEALGGETARTTFHPLTMGMLDPHHSRALRATPRKKGVTRSLTVQGVEAEVSTLALRPLTRSPCTTSPSRAMLLNQGRPLGKETLTSPKARRVLILDLYLGKPAVSCPGVASQVLSVRRPGDSQAYNKWICQLLHRHYPHKDGSVLTQATQSQFWSKKRCRGRLV